MHGIICSFYVEGKFAYSSELMNAKSALSIIKEYDGNKTTSVIGYDSETGEALVRSIRGYETMYEQEGVPVLRKW